MESGHRMVRSSFDTRMGRLQINGRPNLMCIVILKWTVLSSKLSLKEVYWEVYYDVYWYKIKFDKHSNKSIIYGHNLSFFFMTKK